MAGLRRAARPSVGIDQVRPVRPISTDSWTIPIGAAGWCSILVGVQGIFCGIPTCAIRPEDYYCVDVIREALEEGRKRFPAAHWVHFNHYELLVQSRGYRRSADSRYGDRSSG